jgi:transcriptional regulator with XRE-family HTH domain
MRARGSPRTPVAVSLCRKARIDGPSLFALRPVSKPASASATYVQLDPAGRIRITAGLPVRPSASVSPRMTDDWWGEWERTALARAVAVAVVRYRAEYELSQRELGGRLGMKQPQVARLELGEVNPSMETLMRVSAQLGIEFTIDVRPAGTPAHNVTKRAQANNLVGSFRTDEPEILVAAR